MSLVDDGSYLEFYTQVSWVAKKRSARRLFWGAESA